VKAVIAGNSVADGDCDQIIGNALETEEFESDQHGSDRTVGDAAEKGRHSRRRADGSGESEKLSHNTAESRADTQGGNDLAAPETDTHGNGCKNDLPEKIQGTRGAFFYRPLDQLVSGAH